MHAPTSTTFVPFRRALARSWDVAVAGLLAVAVLAIGLGAASPEMHEEVHCDADQPEHVCAITLAATGYCDTSAEPLAIADDRGTIEHLLPEPGSYAWNAPSFWLIPAQAPPA